MIKLIYVNDFLLTGKRVGDMIKMSLKFLWIFDGRKFLFFGWECYLYKLKMPGRNVIQVLDFSGSFSGEAELFPKKVHDEFSFAVTDFSDLDGTMCFCSEESAAGIRLRMNDGMFMVDAGGIHWIDTGDYHYLTYFYLEKLAGPFTLVLMDHHPDDQPSVFGGDLLSCGGWVLEAMEHLTLMRRVVTIGPDGYIMVRERISSGKAPWRIVRKVDLYGVDGEEDLAAAEVVISETVPVGERVYLSLDKDVLSMDFSRTNWSQGGMSLSGMLRLLQLLKGRVLLGADICGGLTVAKGATGEDFAVNARTDAALLEALAPLVCGKG